MNIKTKRAPEDRSPIDDPELAAALSAMYSAPAAEDYWTGLESRIMARLKQAESQGEWWSVFAEWRSAGLVAAGLMLSLAGAALWKEYKIESDIRQLAAGAAYWTVFDGETEDMTIAFSVPTSRPAPTGSADRFMFTAEP
jgi:anti-sigma-K factor RskA